MEHMNIDSMVLNIELKLFLMQLLYYSYISEVCN